jgi:hypothetical protein
MNKRRKKKALKNLYGARAWADMMELRRRIREGTKSLLDGRVNNPESRMRLRSLILQVVEQFDQELWERRDKWQQEALRGRSWMESAGAAAGKARDELLLSCLPQKWPAP